MIKITQAEYLQDKIIQVHFSDGSWGDYDLQPLIDKQSSLTKALESEKIFKQFYLEMGALCWRNGLELGTGNIQDKLKNNHQLHHQEKVA